MPAKTQREREAEQRKAKLDRIAEQVTDGSLVIRQMTDADRRRFAARPGPRRVGADRRPAPARRTRPRPQPAAARRRLGAPLDSRSARPRRPRAAGAAVGWRRA